MSSGKKTTLKVVKNYLQEMFLNIQRELKDKDTFHNVVSLLSKEISQDFFTTNNHRSELLESGNSKLSYALNAQEWIVVYDLLKEVKIAITAKLKGDDSPILKSNEELIKYFTRFIKSNLAKDSAALKFPPETPLTKLKPLEFSKTVIFEFIESPRLKIQVDSNNFEKSTRENIFKNKNVVKLDDKHYRAVYEHLSPLLIAINNEVKNVFNAIISYDTLDEFITNSSSLKIIPVLNDYTARLEKELRGVPLTISNFSRTPRLMLGVRLTPSNRVHKGLTETLRYAGKEEDLFKPEYKLYYSPTVYEAVRQLYFFATKATIAYTDKRYMREEVDFISIVDRFWLEHRTEMSSNHPELAKLLVELLCCGRRVRAYVTTRDFGTVAKNQLTSDAMLRAVLATEGSYARLEDLISKK